MTKLEKCMVDMASITYPFKKPIEEYTTFDEMREGENKFNFYRRIAFKRGFLYCVEVLSEHYGIDVYKIIAAEEKSLTKTEKQL